MPDMLIRNLPEAAVERIKRAAAMRQMTLGEYLDALSRLHDKARFVADNGSDLMHAELEVLGLETITG